MQKFKNTNEAIGEGLGQYDEVYAANDREDAEQMEDQLSNHWTEANVIMIGSDYYVGIRSTNNI